MTALLLRTARYRLDRARRLAEETPLQQIGPGAYRGGHFLFGFDVSDQQRSAEPMYHFNERRHSGSFLQRVGSQPDEIGIEAAEFRHPTLVFPAVIQRDAITPRAVDDDHMLQESPVPVHLQGDLDPDP